MVKKKSNSKKKIKTKKEKFIEFFKITKKGKEKTIKVKGVEEIPQTKKGQIKNQDRILKNFFITIAVFIVAILIVVLFLKSLATFEYNGVPIQMTEEYNMLFYKVTFPVYTQETLVDYNIFLRNDPRKLDEIPFEGDLELFEDVVVNTTEPFICDGDGAISLGNMLNLKAIGMEVFKSPEAGCDSQGRYLFLEILPGNETKIEQYEPSCFQIYVNNCEILKATERFMLESFVQAQKLVSSSEYSFILD
jgi:hypothetical protein